MRAIAETLGLSLTVLGRLVEGKPDGQGHRQVQLRRFPEKPMSSNATHLWWYRCLAHAGITPQGVHRGEHMHKARPTAGQRVLDKTGNLKAVQKLLGQSSIQTTGDIYADWYIDQLAATMAEVLQGNSETSPRLSRGFGSTEPKAGN